MRLGDEGKRASDDRGLRRQHSEDSVTVIQLTALIGEKLAPSGLEVLGGEFEVGHVDDADRRSLFEALEARTGKVGKIESSLVLAGQI
ncbi:MAG: hypothetical protein QOC63_660 [Mycobacterium sp.]|jgi:hypothetical protein|nr:hypothetical protein [Mycobacterium sp.]